MTFIQKYCCLVLLFSLLVFNACQPKHFEIPLSTGVFDVEIGNEQLIMVIENSAPDTTNGFYIYNRQKAIEQKHPFNMYASKGYAIFESDSIQGRIKKINNEDPFQGTFKIKGKKASIFFWKNKRSISLSKRSTYTAPKTERYLKKFFNDTIAEYDLIYGNAKGYWTETPYLDDPYVFILARGMINFWKGEKDLDLKLDIYRPKADTQSLRPLVLLVHGGAFYIGNKQSETETILAERLASRGYVVASMNYRMGFRMRGYDVERTGYKSVQDVHAALRYLSHHSEKYGIDPDYVYVAGTSAGAIASLTVAYLDNNERPESTFASRLLDDLGNIESSGNSFKAKFKIKAVGNMWGAVNDTNIISRGQNIPVISFHGTNDDIVPIDHDYPFRFMLRINRLVMGKMYGSKPIHEQLERRKIDNKFIIFENAGHEPQLDNFKRINDRMDIISDNLIEFFYKYTAPSIQFAKPTIEISQNSVVNALNIDVKNGYLQLVVVTGGLQISPSPTETGIIWFSDSENPLVKVYAINRLNAATSKTLKVAIVD